MPYLRAGVPWFGLIWGLDCAWIVLGMVLGWGWFPLSWGRMCEVVVGVGSGWGWKKVRMEVGWVELAFR